VYTCYSCFEKQLDEKKTEFAFEGHRFIDLKRLATLAGVILIEILLITALTLQIILQPTLQTYH
jgi:hypothetical protein